MSSSPSISIVTPTFNQNRYVESTINSVLCQGYTNLEYLVLDGGSTDGTLEKLENLGSGFSWRVDTGINQSVAINQGWQEMTGEILGWINSDDVYTSNAFDQVGGFFNENPDVDLLYGDCDYIDSKGIYLRPYPTQDFDFKEYLRKTINFIPQPAAFFRRRVLDQVGPLNESLDYVMDFEYWLRIGRSFKVAYLPQKLASLRLHPEAKSIKNLDRFGQELVDVYEQYFGDKHLPTAFRSLETEAMANIYTRAADCAFWGNNSSLARRFASKAWKYQIWSVRKIWFLIFLGKFGRGLAEKLLKNPYLP
jgi:glycosyltransferase involved in cell wall biosynthesis